MTACFLYAIRKVSKLKWGITMRGLSEKVFWCRDVAKFGLADVTFGNACPGVKKLIFVEFFHSGGGDCLVR